MLNNYKIILKQPAYLELEETREVGEGGWNGWAVEKVNTAYPKHKVERRNIRRCMFTETSYKGPKDYLFQPRRMMFRNKM
jgi:hypothetical protein